MSHPEGDRLLIRPTAMARPASADNGHIPTKGTIKAALVSSHEAHRREPDQPSQPARGYSQHLSVNHRGKRAHRRSKR